MIFVIGRRYTLWHGLPVTLTEAALTYLQRVIGARFNLEREYIFSRSRQLR